MSELKVTQKYYINTNKETATVEELATALNLSVEDVQGYIDSQNPQKQLPTQAEFIIENQGLIHNGAVIMSPALSELTNDVRQNNTKPQPHIHTFKSRVKKRR